MAACCVRGEARSFRFYHLPSPTRPHPLRFGFYLTFGCSRPAPALDGQLGRVFPASLPPPVPWGEPWTETWVSPNRTNCYSECSVYSEHVICSLEFQNIRSRLCLRFCLHTAVCVTSAHSPACRYKQWGTTTPLRRCETRCFSCTVTSINQKRHNTTLEWRYFDGLAAGQVLLELLFREHNLLNFTVLKLLEQYMLLKP